MLRPIGRFLRRRDDWRRRLDWSRAPGGVRQSVIGSVPGRKGRVHDFLELAKPVLKRRIAGRLWIGLELPDQLPRLRKLGRPAAPGDRGHSRTTDVIGAAMGSDGGIDAVGGLFGG